MKDMLSFKQTRLTETPLENVWGDCRLISVHYEPQKILCYQMLIFLFAVSCVKCPLCTLCEGPVITTYDESSSTGTQTVVFTWCV